MSYQNWSEEEREVRTELARDFHGSLVEMLDYFSGGAGTSLKDKEALKDLAALRKDIVDMIDDPDTTELVKRLRFWLASQ